MEKYDWIAVVIAVIALVQPWVVSFWKRFVRTPSVEFHETGKIEIGFSELGGTLALIGTCRAINGDVFVREISATVTKLKNKSQYDFSVLAFRSTNLNASNMVSTNFEVPVGFLVRPDKPVSVYPVLNDKQVQATIQTGKDDYTEKFFAEQEKFLLSRDIADDSSLSEQEKKDVADHLRSQSFQTDYYTKVGREFYWDSGEYRLQVFLKTAKKGEVFSKEYRFSIAEKDSELIRLNVIRITDVMVDGFLGRPESWRFIYSDYKEV